MANNPFRCWMMVPILLLAVACAADTRAACLPTFEQGWVRLGPAGMPMMAGFGRLSNACDGPVTVVAVRSEAFADVSLHRTSNEGGVSRMREVPALRLEAGESATLAPGGLHLMLMHPHAEVREGDSVTVRLELDDGRDFAASLRVGKSAP